jgi:hypothetical protein
VMGMKHDEASQSQCLKHTENTWRQLPTSCQPPLMVTFERILPMIGPSKRLGQVRQTCCAGRQIPILTEASKYIMVYHQQKWSIFYHVGVD